MIEHDGLSAEAAWKDRHKMNEWVEKHASYIAPARDGKLWIANEYTYRLRRVSASGKPLLEILLAKVKEKTAQKSPSNSAATALAQQAEKQGGKAQAFTAPAVIADVIEGADRAIYLLVRPAGVTALALDRYDPVRNLLERAPLSLKGAGRFTLASGKDCPAVSNR